MSKSRYQPAKTFTPEEANARLPLVRAITADMVELSRDLIERRRRLDELTAGRDLETGDLYGDELAHIDQQLVREGERLQEYIDELRELGVEPKSAPEGLVDFPARIDGRLVYLCWKYDEPEVMYWHELDTGFAGRQPLAVGSGSGGGSEEAGGLVDRSNG